jgi:anti-anti-sigma factor
MTQSPNKPEHNKTGGMNISGRTIVTLESQITYSNCNELEEKIDNAIQQNKTEIILDCKNVGLLDSAALQLLVQTHEELRNKGGALKMVGLNDVCLDIMLATRLINMLFIYKDIHEAVTSRL